MKLTYCGLGVADVDAWVRFAVDGLGLADAGGEGARRLRMDDRSWRIAVHAAPDDDILYLGFEVDESEEASLRDRTVTASLAPTDLNADECAERMVEEGFWLTDPGGLRIEFVRGHAAAGKPFRSDLVEGFLTGDQGFGHIVLAVRDLQQGLDFFRLTGLSLSDFITVPMGENGELRIAFMHCNSRHHSIAIAPLPGTKRLNHIMLELTDVDDVLRGYQRCLDQGYKTGGIGRHPNDRMLSFYVTTPAGFDVEYGWGGIPITEDWAVAEYDRISLWGHERP